MIRQRDWTESNIKNSECTHIFTKMCVSFIHFNRNNVFNVFCLQLSPPPPKIVTVITSVKGSISHDSAEKNTDVIVNNHFFKISRFYNNFMQVSL